MALRVAVVDNWLGARISAGLLQVVSRYSCRTTSVVPGMTVTTVTITSISIMHDAQFNGKLKVSEREHPSPHHDDHDDSVSLRHQV